MNPSALLHDTAYPALKDFVLQHTGLSYYSDKDEDLATRISRRVTARSSPDATRYLKILDADPAEMDCLVGELTIGETYFFRQREHFDLLRDTVIPELMERKASSRQIHIWSAGCATGAEPYSIALLLALEFPELLATWHISILGTDLNIDFLAQAREARFGEWTLRGVSPDLRARCFRSDGKRWTLRPEFRKLVEFRYHNLAAPADPLRDGVRFDVILCRNVLIYFSRETIRDVATRLHANLNWGGWLLVGHAEPNAEIFSDFDARVFPAGTVYRKSVASALPPPPSPLFPPFKFAKPEPLPIVGKAHAPDNQAFETQISPPRPAAKPLSVDDIRVLADRGQWDVALSESQHRVTVNPLDAPAQFTLGLVLDHSGAHEDARAALRRAIYLDREFALAHYHLGALYRNAGETAAARRSFHNVLRLLRWTAPAETLPHGDGITTQELRDLTEMHLELITE